MNEGIWFPETKPKKCIILNGPPGSGKDTLAVRLGRFGYSQFENKEPLFDLAITMTGLTRDEWFARYKDRVLKEQPWDVLNGMSQREFLIWLSEAVVKPRLGSGQFGKLSAKAAMRAPGSVVFSDGGFQEEMKYLQDAFGAENVLLVHLIRTGHSFAGDSRSYLQPEGSQFLRVVIEEGNPTAAVRLITDHVRGM